MNYLFAFSEGYDGFSAYIFLIALGLIIFAVLGLMFLPALVIAGLARRKVEKILNYRVNTVITQFDPPHGLSPAEIGLLYGMRCGQNEIMATLDRWAISLAIAFPAVLFMAPLSVKLTNRLIKND